MIRAFITTWALVENQIQNPIVEYINANQLSDPVTCSMFYPDHNGDGVPDKNRVLILVHGQVEIEQLALLAGVRMLPAYSFQKPITEIPQNIIDTVKTAIVNEGIPLSALSGIVIYGDFLKKVANYFDATFKDFGRYENVLSVEFA